MADLDLEPATPLSDDAADLCLPDYPRPAVAMDLVIFTLIDADLKLLLIRRRERPFQGCLALPGGFLRVGATREEPGEDLEAGAQRELAEETGLPLGTVFLEQLYTFGDAHRDPRGRVISVAFFALVRPDLAPFVQAGGDAADARWESVSRLGSVSLAFDHARIVQLAVTRLRERIQVSSMAFELVPPTFSIPELRAVYEAVGGAPLDPANFRKRFDRMVADGLIEKAPGKRVTATRPAAVYQFIRGGRR